MAEDAKPTDQPQALPPIAAKARDLEALRAAVVDAAGVSGALWFSYLFVLLYLVIAAGGVTHRDLLFRSPIKLPFLNVDLPLLGFFWLGPLLVLVVHAYVLLHFTMLADKVSAFHVELQAQIVDDDIRTRLRRQLPSNVFVQFLAGTRQMREGVLGAMVRLIALMSLVIGPVALLVFFQLQFLPYQEELIAWWQRMAVVADLALLWRLWPSIARGEMTSINWRDLKRPSVIAAAVSSFIPVLVVFAVATFQGEWLHKNPISARIIPRWGDDWSVQRITPQTFLVAGDIDLIAGKTTSFWSNRMVVPNIDQPPKNFSLRGRHLVGAVLSGAQLGKVDFVAANLTGAAFADADLRDSNFGCYSSGMRAGENDVETDDEFQPVTRCTRLQSASFYRAQMQGAKLDGAWMEGASLEGAQLQGASLKGAQLQGAILESAQLQGATLNEAMLAGASLNKAELQGASLELANLAGASLIKAQLQGALLKSASLDAASLDGAQLHGASLVDASLRGASFDSDEDATPTQLQAANLEGADIQAASFIRAMLWRTKPASRALDRSLIAAPETMPKYQMQDCDHVGDACPWSATAYVSLKQLIEAKVPAGDYRGSALARISVLDPEKPLNGEAAMAKAWNDRAKSPPSADDFQQDLAEQFRRAICDEDYGKAEQSSRYVADGVLKRIFPNPVSRDVRPRHLDAQRAGELATALMDRTTCPRARGISGRRAQLLYQFAKPRINPEKAEPKQ